MSLSGRPSIRRAGMLTGGVAAATALISGGLGGGSTAGAAPPKAPKQPTISVRHTSAKQLADATRDGRGANPSVDDFLGSQARLGRNVDRSITRTATVDGTTVVWEKGVQPGQFGVASSDDGNVEAVGVEVDPSGLDSNVPSMAPGMGMSGFLNPQNGSPKGNGCTTITAPKGSRVTSCYEKYKITESDSSFDYYAYNRWGTGKPKDGDKISEFTIRSHPWRGYENTVLNIPYYTPQQGTIHCSSAGTIGFGAYGFSASIPIQNCNAFTDVYPGNKSMGAQRLQNAPGSSVALGADFAVVLKTNPGQNPVMADYAFGQFYRYQGFWSGWQPLEVGIFVDPGW